MSLEPSLFTSQMVSFPFLQNVFKVWSAACMFFELATGEFLFDPKKQKGDVPSSDLLHFLNFEDVIWGCDICGGF